MADNLFEGLPPPAANPLAPPSEQQQQKSQQNPITLTHVNGKSASVPARNSVLKSALKRPKLVEPNPPPEATAPEKKKLRFKTTTDASEQQVIDAMQKIASHIKNPAKFSKASKLAIQLIQAGSVKTETCDPFFAILETAMSSSTSCNDPSMRADFHALFSAAADASECLDKKQKNQLTTWTIRAVIANDLYTDDSFLFSKTAGRIKEAITNLPVASEEDDMEESSALKDEKEIKDNGIQIIDGISSKALDENNDRHEPDPFGLDALIPSCIGKKGEKSRGKKEAATKIKEEEEAKRFLKSQREALISCLEIAARRYKTPWCQTTIDILVKHAYDNVAKFTSQQRSAIGKLWASIKEQHTRRKQGKSVSGKLDVTAFEYLQEKYAGEKISIRHAVGGSGERRAQQWLG